MRTEFNQRRPKFVCVLRTRIRETKPSQGRCPCLHNVDERPDRKSTHRPGNFCNVCQNRSARTGIRPKGARIWLIPRIAGEMNPAPNLVLPRLQWRPSAADTRREVEGATTVHDVHADQPSERSRTLEHPARALQQPAQEAAGGFENGSVDDVSGEAVALSGGAVVLNAEAEAGNQRL
jgi:hypothetical protein